MTAYFISFRDTMKDASRYAAYLQQAGGSLAGREAKVLVGNGALTPLEGAPPDGIVIIEFPTVQAARDWYEGEAYQAVVGERLAATEGRAVIVEGLG
ncbi:MAG TPA: DUF1330 domain-containing protein [Caulobacteraceae bacterium]|jgi:uncharacterized protein (DUF1330 family)|nr:DUF1330 domain-containing protein [Caulobacteraceae bacterium]